MSKTSNENNHFKDNKGYDRIMKRESRPGPPVAGIEFWKPPWCVDEMIGGPTQELTSYENPTYSPKTVVSFPVDRKPT